MNTILNLQSLNTETMDNAMLSGSACSTLSFGGCGNTNEDAGLPA